MKPAALLVALLAFLTPEAAQASTMPRMDFKAGQTSLAVGFADLNLDHAVSNQLSVGASMVMLPGNAWAGALRATHKWYGTPSFASGMIYSVGLTNYWPLGGGGYLPAGPAFPPKLAAWFQPAWAVSGPLGAWGTIRFSIGPVFYSGIVSDAQGSEIQNAMLLLAPNLELDLRVAPSLELTLGGNSVAGLRGIF